MVGAAGDVPVPSQAIQRHATCQEGEPDILCNFKDEPVGGVDKDVDNYRDCFTLSAGAERDAVCVLVHVIVCAANWLVLEFAA